jgi:hypothetical protein
VLLDSTHKKWIAATAAVGAGAVGLYVFLSWRTPGGLTGGSTPGLWFGVVGSALMIYAGLLSALRHVPSWWPLGSRQTWMRGHIWLGLLSGLLILCHSGLRWGGPLEIALWFVLIAVLLTGVYGLVLQQILPGLLRRRGLSEAAYEQLPHLCGILRCRADELAAAVDLWPSGIPAGEAGSELHRFHDGIVRPYFEQPTRQSPLAVTLRSGAAFEHLRARLGLQAVKDPFARAEALFAEFRARFDVLPDKKDLLLKLDAAAKKIRDNLLALPEVDGLAPAAAKTFAELPAPEAANTAGLVVDLRKLCQSRWLAELEAVCKERRGYAEQERIHRWLHGWLLLHIPLSLALLVLGVLHAVASLYY